MMSDSTRPMTFRRETRNEFDGCVRRGGRRCGKVEELGVPARRFGGSKNTPPVTPDSRSTRMERETALFLLLPGLRSVSAFPRCVLAPLIPSKYSRLLA